MSTGSITVGSLVLLQESLSLNDLVDVDAETPANNDMVLYKDATIEPAFTTGWHATPLTANALSGLSTENAIQNDILAYNDGAIDPTYGVVNAFYPKNVGNIFTDLESTVNSIVGLNTAKIQAESGNAAKTDMVMFTDTAGAGGVTCSIGSNGSNNILSKKEPSDGSFSFVQTLDKGEIANLIYPVGTVLRSSKGIYGFSGPLPTPLGPQSFSLTQSQFYASGGGTVNFVSMGTEVTVSLLTANRLTTLSGPTTVAAYQPSTFTLPSAGEFFLTSSGPICASVNQTGNNIRPLLPMTTELLTMNTGCRISALEATTSVTYYRRTGVTGTVSVSAGTSTLLNAGSDTNLSPNGCIRVTSDKPISSYTQSDSIGSQSLSGFPVSQMAQLFSNPSFIDSTNSYGRCAISIASIYEGTATVYTSSGVELDTFDYTRSVAVTTAADQDYPAAGRWQPFDVSAATTLDGGYIETNTPAVCIMNFSGDSVWGAAGEEIYIAGTTPDEIKADIKKDGNGIWRRRDISNTGVVTWNIC